MLCGQSDFLLLLPSTVGGAANGVDGVLVAAHFSFFAFDESATGFRFRAIVTSSCKKQSIHLEGVGATEINVFPCIVERYFMNTFISIQLDVVEIISSISLFTHDQIVFEYRPFYAIC